MIGARAFIVRANNAIQVSTGATRDVPNTRELISIKLLEMNDISADFMNEWQWQIEILPTTFPFDIIYSPNERRPLSNPDIGDKFPVYVICEQGNNLY